MSSPDETPDAAETERLGESARAVLEALEQFNRFEGQDPAARNRPAWLAALDEPLPQRGDGLDEVVRLLTDVVIPNGLRNGAPGFTGWVTTAPTTVGVVTALAASVAGSQRHWTTTFNHLEMVALRWLAELLGLPGDVQGTFTSGGASANLVGLGAARQWAFEQTGHDAAELGISACPPGRIYASEAVHHVVTKAAGVLGLGRRGVRLLPTDDEERIDVTALASALAEGERDGIVPIAIVANGGSVNAGSVDPIAALADLAEQYGSWLHVDGAYGGFGLLDPRTAPLFEGLERAGSFAVDPHKWLAAPLGCGAAFVRDRDLLFRTFTLEPADYLEGSEIVASDVANPFDAFGEPHFHFGIDQSATSRGARVWAILKEIGADGMRERVVRHNDFARRVAELVLADDRLELFAPPTLSICCFRYRAPELGEADLNALNASIVARLHAETPHVPSTTRLRDATWIRPCYINPRTTRTEVDGLVDAVRQFGDQAAGTSQPL
jgi:aromatic-L-amino-acid/L-tryptophan decarboxylase